jgi:hypothetical protein
MKVSESRGGEIGLVAVDALVVAGVQGAGFFWFSSAR